jgi:putative ABC transport system permease protein
VRGVEIVRNITRRKLRSILTISGIVIGVLALTTLGSMAEHFNALVRANVDYFGDRIPVESQATSLNSTGFLPISKADEIAKVAGVAAVFPDIQMAAEPGGSFSTIRFGPPLTIVAHDPAETRFARYKLRYQTGHDIAPGARGEVALGSDLAGELKARTGDVIYLPVKPQDAKSDFTSHSFTVVGVLDRTLAAPDSYAYVSVADAQMLLADDLPPAVQASAAATSLTQGFVVFGSNGTDLDKLADRITRDVSGVKATRPSVVIKALGQAVSVFTAITTGAALIALVVGGLSVVNTMMMSISERVREIGLKKAIGAKTHRILREYLTEAIVIGVIGGLLGLGLGLTLTQVLDHAGGDPSSGLFLLTPRLAVFALGFATLLGCVAGIIPAFRAARMDPVTALRAQ